VLFQDLCDILPLVVGATRRTLATAEMALAVVFSCRKLHKIPFFRVPPRPRIPKLESLIELEKTSQEADDKGEFRSREHD
jgi:hypothetical protein